MELKRKKGDKMLGVEVTTHEGGLGVVILGVQAGLLIVVIITPETH